MKPRPDALSTVESEYGRAKPENGAGHTRHPRNRVRERKTCKRDPTHSALPKTSPEAQNLKKGPDALSTVQNEFGSAKHE
jgi:hypothetical protein